MNHYEFFNLDRAHIDLERFERTLRDAYFNKLFELAERRLNQLKSGQNTAENRRLNDAEADRTLYSYRVLSNPETRIRYDLALLIAAHTKDLMDDNEIAAIDWKSFNPNHVYAKIGGDPFYDQHLIGQIDLPLKSDTTSISGCRSFFIELDQTGKSVAITSEFGKRALLTDVEKEVTNTLLQKSTVKLIDPIWKEAPFEIRALIVRNRYASHEMTRAQFESEYETLEKEGTLGLFDPNLDHDVRCQLLDFYHFGRSGMKHALADLTTRCEAYEDHPTQVEAQRRFEQRYREIFDRRAHHQIYGIDCHLYERAFSLYCYGPRGLQEAERWLNGLCDEYEAMRSPEKREQIIVEFEKLQSNGGILRINDDLCHRLKEFSWYGLSEPAQSIHESNQSAQRALRSRTGLGRLYHRLKNFSLPAFPHPARTLYERYQSDPRFKLSLGIGNKPSQSKQRL
jgi:hypothetical protein